MQKQVRVQQALKTTFPEFNDKKLLIDYYVSFDFPQKQMRMVSWWQKIIEYIIEHENRTFITYQQLVSYLTIYNLKPTPLQSIVNYLAKREILGPQNQQEVRQAMKEANIANKKSFFNSIMSYISKPTTNEQVFFKFVSTQKIYSKKIKEYKKNQIKKILPTIFADHCSFISLFKLIQDLQTKILLDKESIIELLKELNRQKIISLSQNQKQQFVLYSHNKQNFDSKQWIELQRMKFCLKEEIQKFEFMISKQEQKIAKLKEKAKEQIVSNRKGALATCKEIKQKEKKIENITTRKRVLDNQITQLQYNQMNKTTIDLLQQAHTVYQQTLIDQNKLDELIDKNMQIEITSKQTNQKIESFASRDDLEQEVDEMLKDLEKEVMKQPQRQKIKVEIPMEIESAPKQSESEGKGKKMDIQYEPEKNLIKEEI